MRSNSEDEDTFLANAAQEVGGSRDQGQKKQRLKSFFKEGKKLLDNKDRDSQAARDGQLTVGH